MCVNTGGSAILDVCVLPLFYIITPYILKLLTASHIYNTIVDKNIYKKGYYIILLFKLWIG